MHSNSTKATTYPRTSLLRRFAGDFALWFAGVASLQLFRGFLLWRYREQLGDGVTRMQVLRCFVAGFRFDASVTTYLVLPVVLLSIVLMFRTFPRLHQWLRLVLTILAASLCATAFIADTAYFKEYNNQFNHWIFGLIYDDRQAIARTVWKSYPVLWLLLLLSLLAGGLSYGVWRWVKWIGSQTWLDGYCQRGWQQGLT